MPRLPSQEGWRASLRRRARIQRGTAWAWFTLLVTTVLASSGLAGWAWIALFDTAPPWDLVGGVTFLLETPLILWLASRVKNPVPGAPPEEIAADAFFHDPARRL